MNLLEFRASGVGDLMGYPDKDILPAGAITALSEQVKFIITGRKKKLDGLKAIEKGNVCEDEAIDLINLVKGTSYTKNASRKGNGLLTGECDIFDQENNLIIDIKNALCLDSFPMIISDNMYKKYQWQLIAYMILWGAERAEINYCLVDTPDELISKYDDITMHKVSDIDPKFRLSILAFERDIEKEQQLLARVKLAQDKLKEMLADRGFDWQALEIEF